MSMAATALPVPGGLMAGERPAFNPWIIALTVTMATFMEVLDTSIANVALDYIAGDLGVSHDEATWVLTTYLVANAIVLPLSGWLSSVIGRKRFYMLCVLLFTVSSALCGCARSLGELILFRILQGAGGGGLQPSEQGILLDTFPPAKRGMAMSVYGMAILVAPIMGPTLGGWIVYNYNWRWIFFINVPVGCLSLFLSGLVLEDPPYLRAEREARRGKPLRIDFIGLGLLALGLGALEIIYDRGQIDDWFGSRFIVTLMFISGICLLSVIVWELNHPHPIINLRLLADRNFGFASLVIYFTFAILYGSTVVLPDMLQALFGYTAYQAGLVLSPGGIVTMLMMPLVGFLLNRGSDARWLIFLGLVLVSAAAHWMSLLNLEVAPHNIILPRCLQMLGVALIFSPINTAAYTYLPREQSNNATGIFNMIRNEGSSFGVAVVTTLVARRSQFHQGRLVDTIHSYNLIYQNRLRGLTELVQARRGLDAVSARHVAEGLIYQQVQRQSASLSYFDVFVVFSLAALLALPLVLLMRRSVASKGSAIHVH